MPRFRTIALACVTISGLSCAVPSPRPLPAVSAAPPVKALDPVQHESDAALVSAILEHMEARPRTGMTRSEIRELAHTIVAESRRHDVDPALVLAVIHVESRYDAFAVSPVGAMGLMQILPSTGRELAEQQGIDWIGPQTLFDPVANVRIGVAYLKQLSDRYGSTSMALAAYNWGPGRIDRRLRSGTPLPTAYPALVLEAHSNLRLRRS